MKISIVGLGWYGTPLAKTLLNEGHRVAGSTRSHEKKEKLKQDGIEAFVLNPLDSLPVELSRTEVLVLNIPPFEGEIDWFKSWNLSKDVWVIFISSTSQAPLLLEQEKWVQESFSKWTILRFGGLIGGGRHPGKHLSGRKNLPGRLWPVNLIHQNDVVAFTKVVLEKNITLDVINVVSDDHPTRQEFYTDYCQSKSLPLPEFDLLDSSEKSPISNERLKHYYSTFTSLKND